MDVGEKQKRKSMDVTVELSLLQKRFTGAGVENYGTILSGSVASVPTLTYFYIPISLLCRSSTVSLALCF